MWPVFWDAPPTVYGSLFILIVTCRGGSSPQCYESADACIFVRFKSKTPCTSTSRRQSNDRYRHHQAKSKARLYCPVQRAYPGSTTVMGRAGAARVCPPPARQLSVAVIPPIQAKGKRTRRDTRTGKGT